MHLRVEHLILPIIGKTAGHQLKQIELRRVCECWRHLHDGITTVRTTKEQIINLTMTISLEWFT
jgi:hypothetical protein